MLSALAMLEMEEDDLEHFFLHETLAELHHAAKRSGADPAALFRSDAAIARKPIVGDLLTISWNTRIEPLFCLIVAKSEHARETAETLQRFVAPIERVLDSVL